MHLSFLLQNKNQKIYTFFFFNTSSIYIQNCFTLKIAIVIINFWYKMFKHNPENITFKSLIQNSDILLVEKQFLKN